LNVGLRKFVEWSTQTLCGSITKRVDSPMCFCFVYWSKSDLEMFDTLRYDQPSQRLFAVRHAM